ncbi:MAG: response regulator transcription factor [Christensenellaceae bacterium]|jgi:two-component system OmpR family response regulator
MKYTILIVEDDSTLLSALQYNLEAEGYAATCAADAHEAREKLVQAEYALVVMDVNLPDGSGFDLCRELRSKSDTPVVFLTANDLEQDMLRAYELGADDYITKPFSLEIFLKKVAAMLKRAAIKPQEVYSDGCLFADFTKMDVRLNNEAVALTPLEFRILKTLIKNPGAVLTRQVLLEKLWDTEENFVDEHALTAGMSRLRGKIEQDGNKYIKTIYGMGYMWMGAGNE